jgi:hypothetical protein
MSSNRLIYDNCEYNTKLGESVGPLEYMLNPMQYENCNKCRIELGVVGGNNVSHVKGNLVDLESDLMGVTRKASLCPSRKFKSICATSDPNNCQPANIAIDGPGCNGNPRVIDTTMTHLPSCNMFRYKPTPLPPALRLPKCPSN